MTSILVIDDEENFRSAAQSYLIAHDYKVAVAKTLAEAHNLLASTAFDTWVLDLMLQDGNGLELLGSSHYQPSQQVIVITGHGGLKTAARQLAGPGLNYLTKPVSMDALVTLCQAHEASRTSVPEPSLHFGCLLGESECMQQVYNSISQVAATEATVMISGESGTGKELVAQAIHLESQRAGDLVPINCGALSNELIASELFGHERGSFTGAAKRRIGAFERAADGTLFLDEITEMPIDQQPHLLRALESREITRVGGEQSTDITARVVTATNRDVFSALENNKLREDLYYRLSAFPILLPPLRERTGDVPLLVNYLMNELNRQYSRDISVAEEDMLRLEHWHWPGNVRELRHAVHRAVIATPLADSWLNVPDSLDGMPSRSMPTALSECRSLKEIERDAILATLNRLKGNRKDTASTLGISPKTLYNRLQEYDVTEERLHTEER